MSRTRLAVIALAVVLVIAVIAFLLLRDDGDAEDNGKDADPTVSPSASSTAAVVPDDTWCAGWQGLVAAQGQYVASPTTEAGATLLAVVDELHALGVPESLDPAGYTELTAVLDDIRASVDPSFTPSVVPSEPADVGSGHDHDHGDEGQAEEEHREAPFGTWLADYCAA